MQFKPIIKNTASPGEMTIADAIAYQGREWRQWKITQGNMYKSMKIVGASLGLVLLLQPYFKYEAKRFIHGSDNKGGEILTNYSRFDHDDVAYSREFQKMRYLTKFIESKPQNSVIQEAYLQSQGEKVPTVKPRPDIQKQAPHVKYL